jgi:hypothetical protein
MRHALCVLFVVAVVAMFTLLGVFVVHDQRRLARHGFRRTQEPPVIRRVHRWGAEALEVRCGARVQWWNASYPLAKVTVDHEWLQVAGVPTYDVWIERARVTGIRVFEARMVGSGVLFTSQDGVYDSTVVWLFQPQLRDVLERLEQLGWPVVTALDTRG